MPRFPQIAAVLRLDVLLRIIAFAALGSAAFAPAAIAAEKVDLLLVLAADVSRSVDQPKYQLQR
jgi:hypothetical protein